MRTVGLLLVGLLAACGGTTRSRPGVESSQGGTDSGSGGSTASDAGSGALGGSALGGSGGVAGNPGVGTGGAIALGGMPAGGTRSVVEGGAGGEGGRNPLECDEPYAGTMGGPRIGGPDALVGGGCDSIPDDVLIARFESWEDRVASGFYYEPEVSISYLQEPCSMSEADTASRGSANGQGVLEATYTTPWLYEATYCGNGLRQSVRNVRCDYFDGELLADHTPENLAFLGSILWWGKNHNLTTRAILGYSVSIGSATDWVDLCTLSGTQGDSGSCDEVRLERTRHSVHYDGKVMLGEPEVVRTIQGACR